MRLQSRVAMAILIGGAMSCSAQGTVLFDSVGFEAPEYFPGKLPGQRSWMADHFTSATAEVQQDVVRSGAQALRLGSEITPNAFYPPVSYLPSSGEIISVECDIARTVSATPSFGFFMDVHGSDGLRVARAGLGRDGQNIRAMRTTPLGTMAATPIVYGSLQWVHFEMQLDFATHTWSLLVDGAAAGTGMPMTSSFSSGISSADLTLVTFIASADAGYFDNYRIRTVPGPGMAGMVALGAWSVGRRRRGRGLGS